MTGPLLDRLAARASADPSYLGHLLNRYAADSRLDDTALAARLGCPVDRLAAVRLCRVPREHPAEFREDVEAVAAEFGLNPLALAVAVRGGQAQLKLAAAPADDPGVLLAARDREPEGPR